MSFRAAFRVFCAAQSQISRYAYVIGFNTSKINVIDLGTLELVPSSINVGAYPRDAVCAPDSSVVYVANSMTSGSISVISTASQTVIATITGVPFATHPVRSIRGLAVPRSFVNPTACPRRAFG
ncbi:MAG: hypothetical protein PHQ23_06650 [Candidatus Wallbacteria bacterium]|nr:hypothetical protein [Candidatus Wallbacteria bacterium]